MEDVMAGYDGFSKSNNAIEAEEGGRFPVSKLAKRLGVKTKAIKALMEPCEYHHTSKMYNYTDFYDEDDAMEIIDELKAWKEPAKTEIKHEGCRGEYLEWRGSRKRSVATKIEFKGILAIEKGDWFTLFFQDGTKKRKKKNTNGFNIYKGNKRLNF